MPGPQGMPGILGRIESRAFPQFLHHARHIPDNRPGCTWPWRLIAAEQHSKTTTFWKAQPPLRKCFRFGIRGVAWRRAFWNVTKGSEWQWVNFRVCRNPTEARAERLQPPRTEILDFANAKGISHQQSAEACSATIAGRVF